MKLIDEDKILIKRLHELKGCMYCTASFNKRVSKQRLNVKKLLKNWISSIKPLGYYTYVPVLHMQVLGLACWVLVNVNACWSNYRNWSPL